MEIIVFFITDISRASISLLAFINYQTLHCKFTNLFIKNIERSTLTLPTAVIYKVSVLQQHYEALLTRQYISILHLLF